MDQSLQICHKDTCINATGNLAVALTATITFVAVCYGISLVAKVLR